MSSVDRKHGLGMPKTRSQVGTRIDHGMAEGSVSAGMNYTNGQRQGLLAVE